MATIRMVALILALAALSAQAGAMQGSLQGERSSQVTPLGVPNRAPAEEWLAWLVFHDSLAYYNQVAGASTVDRVVQRQLGLTPTAMRLLRDAGEQYRTDIAAIDAEARAEVRARYTGPGTPPPVHPSAGAEAPVNLPSSASLLAMVHRDGLFQVIEGRKKSRSTAHLLLLKQVLNATEFARVDAWVTTNIAPKVGRIDAAVPVPRLPSVERLPGYVAMPRQVK